MSNLSENQKNILNDFNAFLSKNDPKKSRCFGPGEVVPEYAKKQVQAQLKIYDSILKDQSLMQNLVDFSNSYHERFGLPVDKVMAVCLAILTNLIFIKKINATYEQEKPGETTPQQKT